MGIEYRHPRRRCAECGATKRNTRFINGRAVCGECLYAYARTSKVKTLYGGFNHELAECKTCASKVFATTVSEGGLCRPCAKEYATKN